MRGRKPTPTVLKLIRGNPGRRKIPIDEFQPEAAIPECPAHIVGAAREEWERVTKLLSQVICEADRGALSMLCTAWGRYAEAEKQINQMAELGGAGLFVKAPKSNYPMQSPWLAVSNRAIELHTKLCIEFGLTPSARTRVSTNNVRPPKGGGKGPDSGGWGQF